LDEQDLSLEDCSEFLRLKNLLYLHQHSSLQPEMNKEFLGLLFKQNLLRFKALKLEGVTKGVIGYFQLDKVMYCPYMGFDKTDADHSVIYRLLNTILMIEAKKNARFFNQSAGASFYKSVRRAQGTIEFMAVYTQHLSIKQRMTWWALKFFINQLGVIYMKRF
jgi:hypothetical protein